MGDDFLAKVQDRLPHMLHSEIIDHRRWAYLKKRSESKDEKQPGKTVEAKGRAEGEETEGETEEEGNASGKFGVLTAKARKYFARDCRRHGRNKIRLVKKQAK